MEQWRKVPGYENYEISIETKEGKCRSLNYKGVPGLIKILKGYRTKKGRLNWCLSKSASVTSTKQAACWIALTYPELIENEYFEGAQIDHKDTDPLNNQPSNLRWVTPKENQNNPLTKQHLSKNIPKLPVSQFTKDGVFVRTYKSLCDAEKETGFLKGNISANCRGKIKTAYGFIWRYAV